MSLAALIDEAKAVLFDFDGVLADSEPVFFRTCRDVFATVGHTLDVAEYYDRFTSRGLGFAAEARRAGLSMSDDQIAALERTWRAAYHHQALNGGVPLFHGAADLVGRVASARPSAVASSSPTVQVRGVLRANHTTLPCPVVGRYPGLRPKPASDVFVFAAGRLDTPPTGCLVIEDTVKGLRAAKAVGMTVAVVRTPYTRGPGFEEADYIADRDELMGVLR